MAGRQRALRPTHHPSDADLRRFAKGAPTEFELNQLETHLLVCPQCQERLDALAPRPPDTQEEEMGEGR